MRRPCELILKPTISPSRSAVLCEAACEVVNCDSCLSMALRQMSKTVFSDSPSFNFQNTLTELPARGKKKERETET